MSWLGNLRKLVAGRQPWRPEDEFAYYNVDSTVVREHARRQVQFANEFYFSGLQLARSMQLLDASWLRGINILDIGAGECLLSQALVACGAPMVVAVDAVPEQIWAAALFNHDNPKLQCVIADASELPHEDGSFGLIVGNLLLHHIEPLMPVLREVRRLLAPGGTFVASEPSPLAGALVRRLSSANEAPIRPRILRKALTAAGFIDVTVTYWWNRLQTSRLGIFSPGYVVRATATGTLGRSVPALSRPLIESGVPGLSLDSQCAFKPLVARQVEEVRRAWKNLEKPPEWATSFAPWW